MLKVFRIDFGCCLIYRALGGLEEVKQVNQVIDLATLRDADYSQSLTVSEKDVKTTTEFIDHTVFLF